MPVRLAETAASANINHSYSAYPAPASSRVGPPLCIGERAALQAFVNLQPPELPMNRNHPANPFWSTASFGETADTSPMELSALGEHRDLCKEAHGRWFGVQCAAERVNSFLAARVVTTLVVAAFLIGVTAMVL